MSKSVKRKITVDVIKYSWVLDGNTIDGYKETHIRVHKEGITGGILYIDPYNWHFEVRPKVIANAIRFAVCKGWDPVNSNKPMFISFIEEKFHVLPEGTKYGYQLKNKEKP